ncbi:hypothetical protein JB92DRAFT_2829634 [Gautieria morchelliformis]|nr:hypothetical protein JB92DRAFT_2829634 [Gautieria morchelliformis]
MIAGAPRDASHVEACSSLLLRYMRTLQARKLLESILLSNKTLSSLFERSVSRMFGTLPALPPTTTFNISPLEQQLVHWFLFGLAEHSERDDVETSLRLLFKFSESLLHFQLGQSRCLSRLNFSLHFGLEGHLVTAAATYKSLVAALIAAGLSGNIGIKVIYVDYVDQATGSQIENCVNAWKDGQLKAVDGGNVQGKHLLTCMQQRLHDEARAHSGAGVLQEEGQPSLSLQILISTRPREAAADSAEEREADAYIVPS